MTREEMITMLVGMGFEDDQIVLSTYLTLAGESIINRAYPYAENDVELSVPRKYHTLQVEIAAFMLNKRGAEGQIQHMEQGFSATYSNADIPEDLLSRIVPYVGVIGE